MSFPHRDKSWRKAVHGNFFGRDGGLCLLAFVHLPKVTLTGCEVLPRLMRDQ